MVILKLFAQVDCNVSALFVNVMLDYFGILKFPSFHLEPQTWKVAKNRLNFLSLPHSHPALDILDIPICR